MERERLRQDLEKLRELLAASPSAGEEARQRLEAVIRDIEAILGETEEEPGEESLVERLREATDSFEESHPTLTEVVGRIADVLSRMGI
jgi:uncharacterized membrane protein YccC